MAEAIEYIAAPEEDWWICVCGNKPNAWGFSPCDKQGIEISPGSQWDGLLLCVACGRIGDPDSYSAEDATVRVVRGAQWSVLKSEDFPRHGHMLVVSENWDAVYWIADRHAVIRGGAVELEGPGQRLMQSSANYRGMVSFERVVEYNLAEVEEGTSAARAAAILTNPDRVEETLYPPYISDITKRPKRPYLQEPEGLGWRDALVLDAAQGQVHWLLKDYADLEDSGVFSAPAYGPVFWGQAYVNTADYPDWVRGALIDHTLGCWRS